MPMLITLGLKRWTRSRVEPWEMLIDCDRSVSALGGMVDARPASLMYPLAPACRRCDCCSAERVRGIVAGLGRVGAAGRFRRFLAAFCSCCGRADPILVAASSARANARSLARHRRPIVQTIVGMSHGRSLQPDLPRRSYRAARPTDSHRPAMFRIERHCNPTWRWHAARCARADAKELLAGLLRSRVASSARLSAPPASAGEAHPIFTASRLISPASAPPWTNLRFSLRRSSASSKASPNSCPVSSTGHLIVAGSLAGYTGEQAKTFEIVIQAGAILAVCWEFRARLIAVAARNLRRRRRAALRDQPRHRVHACRVLGLAFNKVDQGASFRAGPGGCAFVVGALVILWAERRQRLQPSTIRIATIDDMRWTDALKVGCAQAFALIPGTSRSGATIIGGMLFGLSRIAATEFSFFLAIPTLFAATALFAVEGFDAALDAIAASLRRRLRRRVHLRIRLRALADPLCGASRLRAVRVVPDRVRRGDPRHRLCRIVRWD